MESIWHYIDYYSYSFLIIALFDGDFSLDNFSGMFFSLGIAIGIILVLSVIGYFVYAAMSGWKYAVLFIMDEKEVVHQQMPRTIKKDNFSVN